MRMYDIISHKRDGLALTDEEIAFFIRGYVRGEIPDEQASALAMAIYLCGMTMDETVRLTEEMTASGEVVDLSRFGDTTVDKHSTGGVGDKTTLIVAPLAVTLGATVAKISGRGLGHTGGTLDKLESIPGLSTKMDMASFCRQVEKIGIAVIGQTANVVPADQKLYALRDTTATVGSLPLIASSIMCKKLASGAKSIVLDVKTGDGAFMKTPKEAETLARMMCDIGKSAGRRMAAWITDMDTPLGCAVGNALEVKEALSLLRGEVTSGPLHDVCLSLASDMASLARKADAAEVRAKAERVLHSGAALETFARMVKAQGGDTDALYHPEKLPNATYEKVLCAPTAGTLLRVKAESVGLACVELGAGRNKKTDGIDPTAGIVFHAAPGDKLEKGQPIATLYASDDKKFDAAERRLASALTVGNEEFTARPLVFAHIKE